VRALTRALRRRTPRLCVGVEAVVLADCWRLSDDGLRTLARRCPDLRRLDVTSCSLITDAALFDVLSRCVNLQHLDVSGQHRLSLSSQALYKCNAVRGLRLGGDSTTATSASRCRCLSCTLV